MYIPKYKALIVLLHTDSYRILIVIPTFKRKWGYLIDMAEVLPPLGVGSSRLDLSNCKRDS